MTTRQPIAAGTVPKTRTLGEVKFKAQEVKTDKKNSSLFLVEFWDSLEDQKKYLKWRLANSGESVNNSIEANLFEPPIFKIYEAMPDL